MRARARLRRRLGIAPGSRAPRRPAVGRLVARVARRPVADADVLARCALVAACGALVAATSVDGARAVAAAPLGAFAGWRAGTRLGQQARRAAAREVARDLPETLDRLVLCVLSGMSLERALRTVAPVARGRLGEAIGDGLRALELGLPRARAYERMAERAGSEEMRRLGAALARAERFGTSVADALAAHAVELRARARADAEAEARTAPVKTVFPLVLCFLPAFVLLTIAPIGISAVRAIGGI